VAKITPKKDPMAAIGRGRFQPHFSKQNEIQAYFPRELKRTDLEGFSGKEFEEISLIWAYFPSGQLTPRTYPCSNPPFQTLLNVMTR
jgi:hypothetical protein